jgi:hypothetical protein
VFALKFQAGEIALFIPWRGWQPRNLALAWGGVMAAPAMGTLRREPIETAGRGVAVAGVRSGISGWRDRAPDPWACGRQGGARRIKIKKNKATAKQSPRLSLTKSLNPKERLSVGNWIVHRLYDYAVKETVEL